MKMKYHIIIILTLLILPLFTSFPIGFGMIYALVYSIVLYHKRLKEYNDYVNTSDGIKDKEMDDRKKLHICTVCYTTDKPKDNFKWSSFFIAVLLSFPIFGAAGWLYLLWGMFFSSYVCRTCNSKAIIPLNSPAGLKLEKSL